jgi:hypothetical protein
MNASQKIRSRRKWVGGCGRGTLFWRRKLRLTLMAAFGLSMPLLRRFLLSLAHHACVLAKPIALTAALARPRPSPPLVPWGRVHSVHQFVPALSRDCPRSG